MWRRCGRLAASACSALCLSHPGCSASYVQAAGMLSLSSARYAVNRSIFFAWGSQSGPSRSSLRTGVVDGAGSAKPVDGSIRKLNSSCWSVISAVTATTQSAWVPTTQPDPPRRRESGCAPSVCVVRVVEPLNLGSPRMPSGHMTSPCVMTVPNSLLKETSAHCVISATMMMTTTAR